MRPRGLLEVVANAWRCPTVQTCLNDLTRNTVTFASRKNQDALTRDVKPTLYRSESEHRAEPARSEPDDISLSSTWL